MYYELDDSHSGVDAVIDHYCSLTPEQQRDEWLSADYVSDFPHAVTRLLSPEGIATYPVETRNTFFQAALQAFTTYGLGPKGEYVPDGYDGGLRLRFNDDGRHIACGKYAYDIRQGQATHLRASKTYTEQTAPLVEIDLAGVVALGLSMPDANIAAEQIIDAVAQAPASKSLRDHLGRLLPTNSTSRHWVKQFDLDAIAGYDWDENLAAMLLSFPDRIIDPQRSVPRRLASELRMPGLHDFYSEATISVFLDYAVKFAEAYDETKNVVPGNGAARELIDFTIWVRQMPVDFLRGPINRLGLQYILAVTSNMLPTDSSGRVVNAREILQKYTHRSRERQQIRLINRGIRQLST